MKKYRNQLLIMMTLFVIVTSMTLPAKAAALDSPDLPSGTFLGSTNSDRIWAHPLGFEGLSPNGDRDCFYAWICAEHFRLTVVAYSHPGAAHETDIAFKITVQSGVRLITLAIVDNYSSDHSESWSQTMNYHPGVYYFEFYEGWRDRSGDFYSFEITVDVRPYTPPVN